MDYKLSCEFVKARIHTHMHTNTCTCSCARTHTHPTRVLAFFSLSLWAVIISGTVWYFFPKCNTCWISVWCSVEPSPELLNVCVHSAQWYSQVLCPREGIPQWHWLAWGKSCADWLSCRCRWFCFLQMVPFFCKGKSLLDRFRDVLGGIQNS